MQQQNVARDFFIERKRERKVNVKRKVTTSDGSAAGSNCGSFSVMPNDVEKQNTQKRKHGGKKETKTNTN